MLPNKAKNNKHKKPDEFISLMDQLTRYALAHRGLLIALSLILIGGLGGLAFWQYWQDKRARDFSQELSAALEQTGEAALKAWELLLQKSPPEDLASLIELKRGALQGEAGQWQEAAQSFERGQKGAPDYLQALLQYSQLVALENAGQKEAALSLAQSLSQDTKHPYHEEASLSAARLLKAQGKSEEAKNLLLGLVQDKESSDLAKREASGLLLLLENPDLDVLPPEPEAKAEEKTETKTEAQEVAKPE